VEGQLAPGGELSPLGFVFGYGSLTAVPAGPVVARLHGWRRGWGVAMDNAETIPGYKLYFAPDGSRPDVCVGFLDVTEEAGAWVNGACLPVDEAALAALDERERNYERRPVTVEPSPGPTWAFVGRARGRERFDRAVADGRCVAARAYVETVERGFRALGGWEDYAACTDESRRPPVRELRRVDLD
jgi:gamma-glutamylcyclotransferase (GGCT)/AIG2-like uncharacterized protein YtfP